MHAYSLAKKLGINTIICPKGAGVASAIGCLVAPAALDQVQPVTGLLHQCDWSSLRSHFHRLEDVARDTLRALESYSDESKANGLKITSTIALDLRCLGQGFAITVQLNKSIQLNEHEYY